MDVSVVIPNYNGQKLLAKNLPKVIAACQDCEVIVVDDGSKDDSVSFLKKNFPKIKLIIHQTNQQFAKACNSGIAAAKGEIVILLNSDAIPQKGFLQPLLKHFKDPEVFSVGCREIEKKDGKQIFSGRTEGTFKRGLFVHWKPKDQESLKTWWSVAGSMAVSKQKYLELGGLDPLFAPAYGEDIDLAWRAKQKGWQILFEKDAIVYHQHETTNKTVYGLRKIEIMSFRNQILFMWKNAKGMQLIKHFLWLPYHLLFTGLRSGGKFDLAFLLAVKRWCNFS